MDMKSCAEANRLLDPLVPAGGRKKFVGLQLPPQMRLEYAAELLDAVSAKLVTERDLAWSYLGIDFSDPAQICRMLAVETVFLARRDSLRVPSFCRGGTLPRMGSFCR